MRPLLHPHRRRLLVVAPVADILESLGGQMIRRVERLAQTRTEPTLRRLAGGLGNDFFDVVNDVALFFRRIVEHRDAVGHAVAEPFPFALVAFFDDRRMMLAHLGVQEHAGANARIYRALP